MKEIIDRTNTIEIFPPSHAKWKGKTYVCAIGENGVVRAKKEGDNGTPIGFLPIRKVLYRADKVDLPDLSVPTEKIKENDGWCDDPNDSAYNTQIKLPYKASHEKLWRDDDLYDIIVVLGHNDNPPIPGLGSAIFMHVARPELSPTAGCIALPKKDLISALKSIDANTGVYVNEFKTQVRPLFFDSYMAVVKNSVGSKLFQTFWAEINGEKKDVVHAGQFACSTHVSNILYLFNVITDKHSTVSSTLRDMERSGWEEIDSPRPGAVIRWEPERQNGTVNEHLGFYIGGGIAISNSREQRVPVEHHWTYGEKNGEPQRSVVGIYWHPQLEKKYF